MTAKYGMRHGSARELWALEICAGAGGQALGIDAEGAIPAFSLLALDQAVLAGYSRPKAQ
jgi:hypothetical protein